MIRVFVDESGDLGTKERYFVIALIIPQNGSRIKNIIKRYCAEHKCAELKASSMTFVKKQDILQKLSTVDDHLVSYIVVDKNNIQNQKLLEDKNLLYNYLFQWLIKPIIKAAGSDIEIILDNHSIKVKSLNSLSDYIRIKAYAEWGISYNITIKYIDSRDSKHVQMADIVANTIYAHYLYKKNNGLYGLLRIDKSIKFPNGLFNR